jgi:hypothetical protein
MLQSNGLPQSREAARLQGVETGAFRTTSQLQELPEPEWLIEGLFVRNSFALLSGSPGVGKTFVALDWAMCLGTGVDWMGRTVAGGKVIYVAAEGGSGIKRRVDAWQETRATMDDAGHYDNRGVLWFTEAVNLWSPQSANRFTSQAANFGPQLVVIDTLSRCMAGADENSPKDMTLVINNLAKLASATGATVLLLHHPPKGNKSAVRGHSALEGALDTIVELGGKPSYLTLRCQKQKDSEPFKDLALCLVPCGASLVADMLPVGLGSQGSTNGAHHQKVIAALAEGDLVQGSSWTQLQQRTGLAKRPLGDALLELVADDQVRKDMTVPSRPKYFLVAGPPSEDPGALWDPFAPG